MNHPMPASSPNHSVNAEPASPAQSALALATVEPAPPAHLAPAEVLQVFSGLAAFDAAQRMARALCSSTLVPREYQGQQGLANSLIALEIAGRMRLSPLVVMQNMTPIHGRPTWSSKFLIATVNASGRFSPLRFVFDNPENPTRCHAVATDKATAEVLEGETITLELARREGWWSRKDRQGNETSKWQTMTGQMLRYRAAAWWANVYCPEIALGLITQEEAIDIEPVKAVPVDPLESTRQIASPAIPSAPATPAAEPWLEKGDQPPAPLGATGWAKEKHAAKPEVGAVPQTQGPPSASIYFSILENESVAPESQKKAADRAEEPAMPAHGDSAHPIPTQASTTVCEPAELASKQTPTRTKVSARSPQANPATRALEPEVAVNQGGLINASKTVLAPQAGPVSPVAAQRPGDSSRPEAQVASNPKADSAAAASPIATGAFEAGLEQIPRIGNPQDLEAAHGRVNRQLTSGEINPAQAQTLWAALAKRRSQLTAQQTATDANGTGVQTP